MLSITYKSADHNHNDWRLSFNVTYDRPQDETPPFRELKGAIQSPFSHHPVD